MGSLPVLWTSRLRLQIVNEKSAAQVLDYLKRNRWYHQPWFATRPDSVFSITQQKSFLKMEYEEFLAGRALPFWLSKQDEPERIIGRFALTEMVQGCFQSAITSWSVDQKEQGAGYAQEAGLAVIKTAFEDFSLHRLEANIMPGNHRSIRLAENLGFELSGFEKRYLQINGVWEDHLHFVKLSDGPGNRGQDRTEIASERVQIRLLTLSDIPIIVDFFNRNREHLDAFSPGLVSAFQSVSYWRRQMVQASVAQETGQRMNLGIFQPQQPNTLIGCIEIRDVIKAPYHCCEIGFGLDQNATGQGYMLEALRNVIAWLFDNFRLHRVNARFVPDNDRCKVLLDKLGFRIEGLQRQALVTQAGNMDLILAGLAAEEFLQKR